MANGYIGKISALVTASTADLSRKLQGSTRDVDRFARSVNSQIAGASASARKSLEGIFTPLQRAQRAFSAGLSLNLIDEAQLRRLQQAVSITEQINKPLGAASRAFQGLSADVAAGLLPALLRAQDAAQRVNDEVATTGGVTASSYRVAEQAIGRAAAALERFRQAEQIIASAPRGQELQFNDPQLFSALQASAAARRNAAAPGVASRVGGALGDAVREVTRFDELVAQAAARVNGIRLAPQVDTSQLERAQGEYQDLIVQQRRAVEELNRISADPAQVGRDADDAAFAAFVRSQQESLKLENQLGAAADERAAAEERVFQAYIRQQQAAKQLDTFLADQDPAERVRRREQEEANARRRREEELEVVEGRRTELGDRLAEQGRRRVRGLTGNVNIDSTPPPDRNFSEQAQRDIDALGTRVGAVRQQLETLPNSIRTRFIPELQRAQAELTNLENSPRKSVDEIERARLAVARLESQAKAAGVALDFRERFGAGAGGFSQIFNTQALRGYTAQLDILQNLIGSVAEQARGPALIAFARLRDFIDQAFRAGTLGAEQTQRRIAELTAEAVRQTSAASGVGAGGLQRQLNRAGDIGRAGLDRFSLAAQQAAFALDDFFSVTGGLDQRIRAVGNNITQLGFIIGGTVGLFASLGVVLTAQALVALVKFSRGGAEAQDISKALNERLQKQKSLLQDISSEFNDLAGSLAEGAFSQATKQSQELESRLDSLIKKIKELRDSTASTLDPELFLLEGRRGTAERSLQGADSVALAAARQARLRDVERQVAERQEVAQRPRPIDRRGLEEAINQSYGSGVSGFRLGDAVDDRQILEILEARQLELGQTVDSWFATFTAPFEQAEAGRLITIVEDARRRFETDIADAIQRLADGAFSDSVRRFESGVTSTTESLDRADEAGGGRSNASRRLRGEQEAEADRFRSVIRQFNKAAAEGRTEEAREATVLLAKLADSAEARNRETRAIVDAANASERFVSLLGRFRELNDAILSDVSGVAEQARREAVQSAATSAAGLSRPDDARQSQARNQRLQQELTLAQDRRRGIESRIEEGRRRFEQESPDPAIRRLVLEAARAREVAGSEQASDFARAQARQRLISADQNLERAFQASPQGRQLQAQLDTADQQARVALGRDALITRGRDLSLTDGQRAGRDLGESIRAINEDFNDRIQRARDVDPFADIADIERQRKDALSRTRENEFRQNAPAIFGLADQVQNAVLQGPSRAAIQATDVSTVEGSRELNRLLRGDDAARDQNLVELQKQSQSLDELVRIAREGGAQIAN
jgi:hypothetical protein